MFGSTKNQSIQTGKNSPPKAQTEAAEPPKDLDGDGLPDEEGAFTEPSVSERYDPRTGILDRDHDGHTNLEAYLNSLTH